MLENLKYSFIILCNTLYLYSRLFYYTLNALQSLGKSSGLCGSRHIAAYSLEDSQDNGIRKLTQFSCHRNITRQCYFSVSHHNGFKFGLQWVQASSTTRLEIVLLHYSGFCGFQLVVGKGPCTVLPHSQAEPVRKKKLECQWLLFFLREPEIAVYLFLRKTVPMVQNFSLECEKFIKTSAIHQAAPDLGFFNQKSSPSYL